VLWVKIAILNNNYISLYTFRFLVDIYEAERDPRISQLKAARFISIMIDGATDKATLENELVYVRFLGEDGPINLFLGIEDVKHANADGIITAIDKGLYSY